MTDNPRAVADPDTLTVRRTITIDATPDKVWTAVTEPEHISRWFGRVVLVGEGVGAHGTITWPDGAGPIPLRVEALEPPHRVTYRWCNDAGTASDSVDGSPSTVFTFTLEPAGVGTRLTVEESGFEVTADPTGNLESHRKGWDGELDELVALLEASR